MTIAWASEEEETLFDRWLSQHIGPAKWIVARASKKRREAGYTQFYTKRKFEALHRAFVKETTPMGTTDHLTEPNPDLADKRARTPPGMAFWAGTGPANTTCRGCQHWRSGGYLIGTGMLMDSPCGKYESMMNGETGPRLPHFTPSCKYFAENATARPIYKAKEVTKV